ncbi:MAG: TetR/AcrR family transcriptional regulator [Actinomycetota bacterium]|nr:TetR/AcrR family transcriptional regulator [Actinomycetota bacterium]
MAGDLPFSSPGRLRSAPTSEHADRSRRSRRPSGDDRERAILATAERLLGERGLGGISVDDLARGAGISRPTFYFYFPSKEAVVLTLLDRVADEARLARATALEQAGEDVAQLWRRGLESILHTFRSHRSLTLAVSQMLPESEEARKVWAKIMEGFVGDIEMGIRSEQERGAALPGLAPRQLAIALNWMTERTFHAALAGQEPSLGEEEALEVVLRVWSRAIYGDDQLGRDR